MKITVTDYLMAEGEPREVPPGVYERGPRKQITNNNRRPADGYEMVNGAVRYTVSEGEYNAAVEAGKIQEGETMDSTAAEKKTTRTFSDIGYPKIYPSMMAVMEYIGSIGKGRKNPQQGYNFRGIDDVLNNLQPALIKAGVFVIPRISELCREERQTKAGGTMIYTTVRGEYDFISAEDGSKVTACTYGEGMDTSDKSTNKAMSAALKYAIIQAFSIPTEELLDSERDHIEPKPKQKPAPVPSQDDGLRHAEPQSNPTHDVTGKAYEATQAQKKKLYAMATDRFGSKEAALEFINWAKGDEEHWTKKMCSDLFDAFEEQATLFADSKRAA